MPTAVQRSYIQHSLETSVQFSTGSSLGDNTSPGNEDGFISHPGEGTETSGGRPSFWTRFVQGTVNNARNGWRAIRRYNPITLVFNRIEQRTVSGLLENARNRNGATTQAQLEAYHGSIQNLFRLQRSTVNNGEPRRLVVVAYGYSQNHDTPSRTAGLQELVQRFLNSGCDVLTVYPGTMMGEFRNRFGIACPLHPAVVETHIGNLVEDVSRNYQDISAVGYSMGAGCIHNNSRRLQNILQRIVYIDPVEHRMHGLGCSITERPPGFSGDFRWYGQSNSYFVNPCPPRGLRPGERAIQIQESGICHETIDNNQRVLDDTFRFIMNRNNRQR